MTPVTWQDVSPGDVVRGKDGHDWTVEARRGLHFVLVRPGRAPYAATMAEGGTVSIVARADALMGEAISALSGPLGADVLHVETEDAPPACPPEYDAPGPFLAHLYVLHGVRFDGVDPDATLTDLNALHTDAHNTKGVGYIDHLHTPDWITLNEE